MTVILQAAAILTGLAVLFAIILALADRFFHVEEDPRLEVLDEMLPGNNCGACGEPGCHAFAEKLLTGDATPAKCSVSAPVALTEIAGFLGVDVGEANKRVARLKCAGGHGLAGELASYHGIESCRAAVLVNGGGRACNWGCLGLADCKRACTFDAIQMNRWVLPQVDPALCTACGDCVDVCPLDLFVLKPIEEKLFVQCSSPLAGEDARSRCQVACDACGRCAADEPEFVKMQGGLPVVDHEAGGPQTDRATWRCPTGAIVWIEGAQFPGDARLREKETQHA